eukprot:g686.t1
MPRSGEVARAVQELAVSTASGLADDCHAQAVLAGLLNELIAEGGGTGTAAELEYLLALGHRAARALTVSCKPAAAAAPGVKETLFAIAHFALRVSAALQSKGGGELVAKGTPSKARSALFLSCIQVLECFVKPATVHDTDSDYPQLPAKVPSFTRWNLPKQALAAGASAASSGAAPAPAPPQGDPQIAREVERLATLLPSTKGGGGGSSSGQQGVDRTEEERQTADEAEEGTSSTESESEEHAQEDVGDDSGAAGDQGRYESGGGGGGEDEDEDKDERDEWDEEDEEEDDDENDEDDDAHEDNEDTWEMSALLLDERVGDSVKKSFLQSWRGGKTGSAGRTEPATDSGSASASALISAGGAVDADADATAASSLGSGIASASGPVQGQQRTCAELCYDCIHALSATEKMLAGARAVLGPVPSAPGWLAALAADPSRQLKLGGRCILLAAAWETSARLHVTHFDAAVTQADRGDPPLMAAVLQILDAVLENAARVLERLARGGRGQGSRKGLGPVSGAREWLVLGCGAAAEHGIDVRVLSALCELGSARAPKHYRRVVRNLRSWVAARTFAHVCGRVLPRPVVPCKAPARC